MKAFLAGEGGLEDKGIGLKNSPRHGPRDIRQEHVPAVRKQPNVSTVLTSRCLHCVVLCRYDAVLANGMEAAPFVTR